MRKKKDEGNMRKSIGEPSVVDTSLINLDDLTPKGLNVRTADKLVLVSVTWAHTIFRFFETFCEDASHNKLRGKNKIVFFGPTDQKLWVFEVSKRSLGRVGMC
jgi:hypothetical protein